MHTEDRYQSDVDGFTPVQPLAALQRWIEVPVVQACRLTVIAMCHQAQVVRLAVGIAVVLAVSDTS